MKVKINFQTVFFVFASCFLTVNTVAAQAVTPMSGNPVKGTEATKVEYCAADRAIQGSFVAQPNKQWVEKNNQGQYVFTETGRDEWSVYLNDPTRSVTVQLDLWTKQVKIPKFGVVYIVTGASSGSVKPNPNPTPNPPTPTPSSNEVVYEDVPDMPQSDINAIMKWIKVQTTGEKLPYCYKQSKTRTAGKPASECPAGTEHDATGGPLGLCYPQCKADYKGVGPVCWHNCPKL